MTPLELAKFEMDNQVGIYDGKNIYSGTGVVKDTSTKRDESEIYCGFSEVHKLPYSTDSISKKKSKDEWQLSAIDILEAINVYNEYCYEIYWINYNGFILKEV